MAMATRKKQSDFAPAELAATSPQLLNPTKTKQEKGPVEADVAPKEDAFAPPPARKPRRTTGKASAEAGESTRPRVTAKKKLDQEVATSHAEEIAKSYAEEMSKVYAGVASENQADMPGSSGHGRAALVPGHAILGGILTCLFGGWGCLIAPLIWFLRSSESESLASQVAKETLNFNIFIVLLSEIVLLLIHFSPGAIVLVWEVVLMVIVASWFMYSLVALVRTYQGRLYRYPFIWRVLS